MQLGIIVIETIQVMIPQGFNYLYKETFIIMYYFNWKINVKSLIFIVVFIFIAIYNSYGGFTNPKAISGNIKVLSSEFPSMFTKDKKYPVKNCIDGNKKTAWVFEKGASTTDIKGLMFIFNTPVSIDGISLINGYAKSTGLYYANNRVDKFEVKLSTGDSYNFQCETIEKPQSFLFNNVEVKWMMVIFHKIKKGEKYDDLCISEISPTLNGKKLIYDNKGSIIYNNGGEYEDDKLYLLTHNKTINLNKYSSSLGLKSPILSPDNTKAIYSFSSDEHYKFIILNLINGDKVFQSSSLSKLNNLKPIKWNDKESILLQKYDYDSDKFTNQYFIFSMNTNSLDKYHKKVNLNINNNKYWRWSERIKKDLSAKYKQIK